MQHHILEEKKITLAGSPYLFKWERRHLGLNTCASFHNNPDRSCMIHPKLGAARRQGQVRQKLLAVMYLADGFCIICFCMHPLQKRLREQQLVSWCSQAPEHRSRTHQVTVLKPLGIPTREASRQERQDYPRSRARVLRSSTPASLCCHTRGPPEGFPAAPAAAAAGCWAASLPWATLAAAMRAQGLPSQGVQPWPQGKCNSKPVGCCLQGIAAGAAGARRARPVGAGQAAESPSEGAGSYAAVPLAAG
eukprot:1146287-Pelagomonas_calceolata.AAC.2